MHWILQQVVLVCTFVFLVIGLFMFYLKVKYYTSSTHCNTQFVPQRCLFCISLPSVFYTDGSSSLDLFFLFFLCISASNHVLPFHFGWFRVFVMVASSSTAGHFVSICFVNQTHTHTNFPWSLSSNKSHAVDLYSYFPVFKNRFRIFH